LFGPAAGTITVVLDALVMSFWLKSEKRSLLKLLFNATAPAIAIRIASEVFFVLSGAHAGHINRQDIGHLIVPVFAFALLYFAINTGLVAGALSGARGIPIGDIWIKNFPAVSINYFVGSSIAMLIVAYTNQIDITVLSIIVPLLAISYLTFRTSMGRLEDANRHIAQVNDLYLSTVETLAMAVDAKDQITHGHIRRVQVYAMELANRLGVMEERQIKAIEAAALLHDMGKLAIPEHILNKPGKLTVGEFDKMKRHADIGADLLSSITFPYPVVPIVRHHHENWDGTGYPSGISGTDIPLGARILSVVDCFDALTSDRPYRPRMTVEEAFATLRERRGTMYDPLIVDKFMETYPEIAPIAIAAGQHAKALIPQMNLESDGTSEEQILTVIRAGAAQTSALAQFTRELQRASSAREALSISSQCLRQLTPGVVYALYRPSEDPDVLVCTAAIGDENGLIVGLRIRKGERITGWCAANDRTISNSNASLDLGSIAELFQAKLHYAISTPLRHRTRLIGVLTAYSTVQRTFSDDHRYAFEQVAVALGDRIGSSSQSTGGATVIQLTPQQRR
jgi:putative nucleotidyltransferase with HDIG domain